jgi:hypothetical protein
VRNFFDVFAWSLRVATWRDIEWRISFMLMAWAIYELIGATVAGAGAWWIATAPLVPLVVMMVHAAAHAWGAHLVGGRTWTVLASAMVDQNSDEVPQRPGALIVSIGFGIAASALLAAVGWFAGSLVGHHVAMLSGMVAALNLLPAYPFDGRRLWRALLWPLLGLRKAGQATVVLGFVASFGIGALAVSTNSPLMLVLAIWCLISALYDYGHQEPGYDPALHTDPRIHGGGRPGPGLWERFQARRAAKAEAKAAEQAAIDAEILDRLLAKVSTQGLPSLTEDERQQLHRISRRQRDEDTP